MRRLQNQIRLVVSYGLGAFFIAESLNPNFWRPIIESRAPLVHLFDGLFGQRDRLFGCRREANVGEGDSKHEYSALRLLNQFTAQSARSDTGNSPRQMRRPLGKAMSYTLGTRTHIPSGHIVSTL